MPVRGYLQLITLLETDRIKAKILDSFLGCCPLISSWLPVTC
jgi:hypothetical protein